jgi:DNA/RNA-binding domain of Phe-tRNA-synthetase-like protein
LLGQVWAAPVAVSAASRDLEDEIAATGERLRREHAGRAPAEIPELQPARELYRIFGIDPTKTRPSSEALLRRVLRSKPLPRISNAVDLGNWMALLFLLPIGLYDAREVEGEVLLRSGNAGELYVGVRKDEVHLQGRPVLADVRGPFGNPTADSLRTAVTDRTRELWMVVFAPAGYPVSRMQANLETVSAAMRRHLRGPGEVATETQIVLP